MRPDIPSRDTHQNVAPTAPPGRPRTWRCADCGVEATSRVLFRTTCEGAGDEGDDERTGDEGAGGDTTDKP